MATCKLKAIARGVMQEYGFLVEFPPEAVREASQAVPPVFERLPIKDLTNLLWFIDRYVTPAI